MKSELMRLDWISKGFEHNPLLKYVNLTIYAGEIHALMGLQDRQPPAAAASGIRDSR